MTVQQTIRTHVPHVAKPPSPTPILELGMAFWGSKALLSAEELGVFTVLAQGPRTGRDLEAALGLASRATFDFLDTLVALGMLARRCGRGGALPQHRGDRALP